MTETIPLEPGAVIAGRYELLKVLGQGSYGKVFHARDQERDEEVALKFLLAEMTQGDSAKAKLEIQFFQRELDLSKSLDHPSIVRTLDFGYLSDGRIYSAMDFIHGDTLEHHIKRNGAIAEAKSIVFMGQILEALNHAHTRGVVHRDVKPANILLTTDGDPKAMLFDFGLATISAEAREDNFESLTPEGMSAMTPGYASPEQFLGEVPTGQVDIYAWGLIFIECLSGEKVIEDTHPMAAMRLHMSSTPFTLPISVEGTQLGYILQRATARELTARYASAAEALEDLRPLLQQARSELGISGGGKKNLLIAGAAVVVILIVVALTLL